jgi:tRNA G18 (ribose-2'-O)-methylase SpoU
MELSQVTMQTRCPYPECFKIFESPLVLDEEDWHWKKDSCPECGQPATLRPLKVLQNLETMIEKESRQVYGGTRSKPQSYQLSVLIEDVRSLWNVGSIFRTSDGAGVEKLYLCGVSGYPPRKEISKTGLGAEQFVPWEYQTGAVSILRQLRHKKTQIVGLEHTPTSMPLSAAVSRKLLTANVCLAVGNEVMGLSAEALSMCDITCHLPMRGMKESLNVAVACGIAIYTICDFIAGQDAI